MIKKSFKLNNFDMANYFTVTKNLQYFSILYIDKNHRYN